MEECRDRRLGEGLKTEVAAVADILPVGLGALLSDICRCVDRDVYRLVKVTQSINSDELDCRLGAG